MFLICSPIVFHRSHEQIQNKKGRTVLHLAADQSDGSLIDALLDAGADMTIKDEEGRTALHLAAASFRRTRYVPVSKGMRARLNVP